MSLRLSARGRATAGKRLLRVVGLMTLACFTAIVRAEPVPVSPQVTDLTSDSELMISYRHQEHMWQTPDGALHLLINHGTLRPNPGLVLFSSFDGGVTWLAELGFARTDRNSTADGLLEGTTLSVVYGDSRGGVVFAQLSYDSTLRTWTLHRTESVFKASGLQPYNPTLAFDDAGVAWCSFALLNNANDDIHLRWIHRPTEGTWLDTGVVVGPTDNVSRERSARPVRIPGGMGLIYRVQKSTYWTTRANSAPPAFLSEPVLIEAGSARTSRNDPYASHFSVVADDGGHLHLAILDDASVVYLRYAMLDGTWSAARRIDSDGSSSYPQIGMANGRVQLAMSLSWRGGALYLSNDYGETFDAAFALRLPAPPDGVSYKTPRLESPSRSSGTLAIVQQYEDVKLQRLMVFKVPVP